MPGTSESLKGRFETSPFFAHLGFEIETYEKDNVVLKLPIQKHLINTNGTVHGGVYATMLDNIMSMVVRNAIDEDIVTVNMNIHFLAPIKAGELLAEATIIQQGYRIVTCEGEIYSNNKVVAKSSGTFKVKRST
ncbi:PaaI family thioesterase [Alteribacter keqinensis]|uniref:PaaI family thioesterase n=1 Tax=Alteribacter keqinensis TaxID=2483800 RepID=A0A3M7TM17_9BACI|nr:PaaI family thioesterase [Alteribacter keqinensis]RNA66230.1 PaaI family thioesterase [Alteribacter keqinensis]